MNARLPASVSRIPGHAEVTAMFGVVVLLKNPILIVGSKHLCKSQKAMFVDLEHFLSVEIFSKKL